MTRNRTEPVEVVEPVEPNRTEPLAPNPRRRGERVTFRGKTSHAARRTPQIGLVCSPESRSLARRADESRAL